MAEPPLDEGALQESDADVDDRLALNEVAAPGTVAGVAVTESVYAPTPSEFTAAMRKLYRVPLVSPGTTAVVPVLVPSLKSVHVDPDLYCTR